MPKMPGVTPKKLLRILLKLGFVIDRQHGSHMVLLHVDGRRTILSIHNDDLATGTLASILKDTGLSPDDL